MVAKNLATALFRALPRVPQSLGLQATHGYAGVRTLATAPPGGAKPVAGTPRLPASPPQQMTGLDADAVAGDQQRQATGEQEVEAGNYSHQNAATGEVGGPRGPEPTRYGDWEQKGRCTDF